MFGSSTPTMSTSSIFGSTARTLSLGTVMNPEAESLASNSSTTPISVSMPANDKPLSELIKPTSDTWKCNFCYTSNALSNLYCILCHSDQYTSLPPKFKTISSSSKNAQTPDAKALFTFGKAAQSEMGNKNSLKPNFNFNLPKSVNDKPSNSISDKETKNKIEVFHRTTTYGKSNSGFGSGTANATSSSQMFNFGSTSAIGMSPASSGFSMNSSVVSSIPSASTTFQSNIIGGSSTIFTLTTTSTISLFGGNTTTTKSVFGNAGTTVTSVFDSTIQTATDSASTFCPSITNTATSFATTCVKPMFSTTVINTSARSMFGSIATTTGTSLFDTTVPTMTSSVQGSFATRVTSTKPVIGFTGFTATTTTATLAFSSVLTTTSSAVWGSQPNPINVTTALPFWNPSRSKPNTNSTIMSTSMVPLVQNTFFNSSKPLIAANSDSLLSTEVLNSNSANKVSVNSNQVSSGASLWPDLLNSITQESTIGSTTLFNTSSKYTSSIPVCGTLTTLSRPMSATTATTSSMFMNDVGPTLFVSMKKKPDVFTFSSKPAFGTTTMNSTAKPMFGAPTTLATPVFNLTATTNSPSSNCTVTTTSSSRVFEFTGATMSTSSASLRRSLTVTSRPSVSVQANSTTVDTSTTAMSKAKSYFNIGSPISMGIPSSHSSNEIATNHNIRFSGVSSLSTTPSTLVRTSTFSSTSCSGSSNIVTQSVLNTNTTATSFFGFSKPATSTSIGTSAINAAATPIINGVTSAKSESVITGSFTSPVFGSTAATTSTSSIFGHIAPTTSQTFGFSSICSIKPTSSLFDFGAVPASTSSAPVIATTTAPAFGFGSTVITTATSSAFGSTAVTTATSSMFGNIAPTTSQTLGVGSSTLPKPMSLAIGFGAVPASISSARRGPKKAIRLRSAVASTSTSSVIGSIAVTTATSSIFGNIAPTTSQTFGVGSPITPTSSTSSTFGTTATTLSLGTGSTVPTITTPILTSLFGSLTTAATTVTVTATTTSTVTTMGVGTTVTSSLTNGNTALQTLKMESMEKEIAHLKKTIEEMESLCIVCEENASDFVYTNCGHARFCGACVQKCCLGKCLLCGKPGKARKYFM